MKRLYWMVLCVVLVIPAYSEITGSPRIVIPTSGGYKRELIPLEIEIPGTSQEEDLDIRLEVIEGEGVVFTSKLVYSISYDVSADVTEAMTINKIGFVPLSTGRIRLKAVVQDRKFPDLQRESGEHLLQIIPRPPLFAEHRPFLTSRLHKDRYYAGEEILLYYDLFFSDMVEDLKAFEPDLLNIPAQFIEPAEDKTIFYSQEATTVRCLSGIVVVGESPGTLSLPPQEISLRFTEKGENIEETLTVEGVDIEILEIPDGRGSSEDEYILLGENVKVEFFNIPEKLKYGNTYSLQIALEGEANLTNIESLRPFLNLPGSAAETLLESHRDIQEGKVVNRLLFGYEGSCLSLFRLSHIRFDSSFFHTGKGQWESIEEISAPFRHDFSLLLILAFPVPVVLFFRINKKYSITKWMFRRIRSHRTLSEEPSGHAIGFHRDEQSAGQSRHNSGSGRDDSVTGFSERFHLTPREQEITSHIINGKSTARMAEELFISPETVKKHIKNIMKKTDTHSRYEIFVLSTKINDQER